MFKGSMWDGLDEVFVDTSSMNITLRCLYFLFQSTRGLRRQFLMTRETNIIVLLKRGEKVDMCNDTFQDVTEHVKCKVKLINN